MKRWIEPIGFTVCVLIFVAILLFAKRCERRYITVPISLNAASGLTNPMAPLGDMIIQGQGTHSVITEPGEFHVPAVADSSSFWVKGNLICRRFSDGRVLLMPGVTSEDCPFPSSGVVEHTWHEPQSYRLTTKLAKDPNPLPSDVAADFPQVISSCDDKERCWFAREPKQGDCFRLSHAMRLVPEDCAVAPRSAQARICTVGNLMCADPWPEADAADGKGKP